MVDCKPMSTPLEAKTKNISNTSLLEDPSFFHELIGVLQYLTLTRSDLSYNVNFVSQYMHSLTVTHLKMVRCILQYVKGTINIDFHFTFNTTLDLYAFSDAERTCCPPHDAPLQATAYFLVETLSPGV
jgi:predicted KAP-like P-loop ATPase